MQYGQMACGDVSSPISVVADSLSSELALFWARPIGIVWWANNWPPLLLLLEAIIHGIQIIKVHFQQSPLWIVLQKKKPINNKKTKNKPKETNIKAKVKHTKTKTREHFDFGEENGHIGVFLSLVLFPALAEQLSQTVSVGFLSTGSLFWDPFRNLQTSPHLTAAPDTPQSPAPQPFKQNWFQPSQWPKPYPQVLQATVPSPVVSPCACGLRGPPQSPVQNLWRETWGVRLEKEAPASSWTGPPWSPVIYSVARPCSV